MDGTKRTAFLSAIYFLENLGYTIPNSRKLLARLPIGFGV